MPMIDKYMTAMPHTINPDLPVKKALEMMREHRIRHVPVLSAGQLLGVVTDRDIKLASSFQGSTELTVNDVMTPDPYCVVPHSPLDQAVFEMAEHRYGCAIIRQENGKVVGVFTATDALRVLGDVLQSHFKPVQS